jgi:uncharacterized protein
MGCMDRSSALALLKAHVKEDQLVRHCIATGAIMKAMAARLGEDAASWERIGILHDIDFEEIHGDMQRHGAAGAECLLLHGIDPGEAEIIRRHNHLLHGNTYTRPVEVVLQAADSSSGLIIVCALVKGGRLSDVTVKTVTKKAKEKSFAAGCDRDRIARIEPVLTVPEFYATALSGLMECRGELGLT